MAGAKSSNTATGVPNMPIDDRLVQWQPIDQTEEEKRKKAVIDERLVNWKPVDPAISAGKDLNSIPRQIGLTARYGLEGVANTAQLLTEPLRYLTDKFIPDRVDGGVKSTPLGVQATKFADWVGLPSPQTPTERVVGDASRLVAGTGLFSAPSIVANAPKIPAAIKTAAQTIAETPFATALSDAPAQQLFSAAGAGLAGGASREAGGSPFQQGVAATVGGLGGGFGVSGVEAAANKVKSFLVPPKQMDEKISILLSQSGVDYSHIPKNIQSQMRQDLASAFKTGEDLSPDAVRRLLDFRLTGATPTRGMLTLDPVQITKEKNLAKIAANSADGEIQGLPLLFNQNNSTVIRNLNNLGGASEATPLNAGSVVVGSVNGRNNALTQAEQSAWDAAKASPGYKQPIYPDGLNAINQALVESALMGFMPKQITDYMAAFQTGQQPFTPQHYKNLRSLLSAELSKGGNEAAAARTAINALDSTPIKQITNPNGNAQASSSIDLVNQARAATAAKYGYQEGTPLVRSVLSDSRTADPEKIAQSFVLNGSLNDARSVVREVGPDGLPAIKDAIATYIKKQALGGAADEVGNVSQSSLNKAIKDVGIEKLRLFFTPEEIAQLQATGRVASYMQVQPIGSAVNNSNSGAVLIGKAYDALKGGLGALPGGSAAAGLLDLTVGIPTKNAANWLDQRKAQDITEALIRRRQQQAAQGLLAPSFAIGGLLSAPEY